MTMKDRLLFAREQALMEGFTGMAEALNLLLQRELERETFEDKLDAGARRLRGVDASA